MPLMLVTCRTSHYCIPGSVQLWMGLSQQVGLPCPCLYDNHFASFSLKFIQSRRSLSHANITHPSNATLRRPQVEPKPCLPTGTITTSTTTPHPSILMALTPTTNPSHLVRVFVMAIGSLKQWHRPHQLGGASARQRAGQVALPQPLTRTAVHGF